MLLQSLPVVPASRLPVAAPVISTRLGQRVSGASRSVGSAAGSGAAGIPPERPASSNIGPSSSAAEHVDVSEKDQPRGMLARFLALFQGKAMTKEKLASLGFGAFCAYGVISNINAGVRAVCSHTMLVCMHYGQHQDKCMHD